MRPSECAENIASTLICTGVRGVSVARWRANCCPVRDRWLRDRDVLSPPCLCLVEDGSTTRSLGKEKHFSTRMPREARYLHRVSSFWYQCKSSKAKAPVAGLSSFINTPTFDAVDPCADHVFVFFGDKVIERSSDCIHCVEEKIIGAIFNCTADREAV